MSTDSVVEKPVRSPCVSICALDEQDICTGCQRTVSEITQWSRMSNDERRVVLGLCDERARACGLMWTVGGSR
ncbi:DUF1289 domain-containing protein [Pseudomonas syringae]|uniref:DUF1289 domain-containing protein n=1 Tax=Pseudomonas syringae TaxID=317 RepID=UPI001372E902|nr:DUF1289 domain-containing protein [Pseudomonas syringae]MDU8427757.1 DUF1289 domain-containing protein [Pseudomonas syringae pv. actinidifoliorum]MDU8519164.1 DUF1289 domain-containing protein [Pseudomonas syringae pv. actinidifoliorum]MDU8525066.1 DUF1289 domain-containing protein [Pseudomonas syringae pv. actinidifoliorum]NAS94822.1 DUF1289 domain-containing protein [Pseudomonas syringae pv. actinidifoliorum]NAT21676.1 DUF1289 domain-containing protein [Pseudomonas syringae pv. actinidifo